ncbi:MAG TPA: two-component regulator propeller domain-containing protein [Bacteroidales bacterium]|nr:two-component regulator propeller domain-containing protein [Bacteroidales bacterium]
MFYPRGKFKRFPFLLFCFALTNAAAQWQSSPDIIPALLSSRLPVDNQNWEISQDPLSGYMYFANSTGLVAYNGLSSRVYKLPSQQGIRSVYASPSGIIYTGSFEDFGMWKPDGNGGLVYSSLTKGIRVPKNDEIWNILELNGTIYFQSFTTIYALKGQSVKTISAPAIMLFMFRVGDRFIVQALGKGLYYFDGNHFVFIEGSNLFAVREVLALIQRPSGFWVCTAKDGIYTYDGSSFDFLPGELSRFLSVYTCNAGISSGDSLFVFGTILNGIVLSNANGDILKVYNYSNGLNNNTVLSLYKDNRNNIWAGLDEGINCINPDSRYKQFADKNGRLGTIYSLLRKNNLIYFGTNHGLFAADLSEQDGDFSFTNLSLVSGTQGQVWNIFEYDNRLFCGHNEGTFIINDRSVTKMSNVTGGWCFAGYHDDLLQGTYTGIVVFRKNQPGNWYYSHRVEGFGEPTRYIEVDYLGYVWAVHHQNGIYRLELNDNTDSVVNSEYFSTLDNQSGKITISSINNQVVFMNTRHIFSFDAENKKFFPVKELEKGLGEYARSTRIIHQEKNRYWFILEDKIALFEISRSFEARKIRELLQRYTDLPGREQQIIALDQHNLLIPTRQAFSILNMRETRGYTERKPPLIAHTSFSGKSQTLILTPWKGRITIPNRDNNLTVFIADPNGYGTGENVILYRVPQIDPKWRTLVTDNFSFLNLHHGSYTVQVKSDEGNEITEFAFTIKRPWYISMVALGAYLIALAGLTLLIIRIFKSELNRQRQIIEYEVRKNKLENELDYKSFELMLTMRYLIRKTEILKELQYQIDSLKEVSAKYPVKFVKEMERIINEGLDSQTEEWKTVMNNLKMSQEGFFRRLKEKFPNLTPNDLRLCSYLRMNFSTKEIAHLLNISGRAVEIGRYRLRTKMHLDHSTNLTEFLIAEAEKEA